MNIYVGNLASTVVEDDLKELFSTFGTVNSVKIIKDFETGRSKGFAFVDVSQTSGQQAIETLNDTEFNGNTITVSEAYEKRNNTRRNFGGGAPRNNNYGGGGGRGGRF